MKLKSKYNNALNLSKAIVPNNTPTEVLKLVINVSSQVTELFFNLHLSHGIFPLIRKTSS